MAWGNIYKRRIRVFTLALIIYLDYKVNIVAFEKNTAFISSLFFFLSLICYVSKFLYVIMYRLCRREVNGLKTNLKRLLYGRRLMNAMLGVYLNL